MVVPCCRWVGVPSHSLTGANLNGVTVTSTTNSNTVTWSDTTCRMAPTATPTAGPPVGHLLGPPVNSAARSPGRAQPGAD